MANEAASSADQPLDAETSVAIPDLNRVTFGADADSPNDAAPVSVPPVEPAEAGADEQPPGEEAAQDDDRPQETKFPENREVIQRLLKLAYSDEESERKEFEKETMDRFKKNARTDRKSSGQGSRRAAQSNLCKVVCSHGQSVEKRRSGVHQSSQRRTRGV